MAGATRNFRRRVAIEPGRWKPQRGCNVTVAPKPAQGSDSEAVPGVFHNDRVSSSRLGCARQATWAQVWGIGSARKLLDTEWSLFTRTSSSPTLL